MFIPDLDFVPSRISDLGSNNNKKEEGEKICCLYFIFNDADPGPD
jgi:hypothetical protein